ncbi:unnamed protein product [Adineta steineri]|uniref:Uncharacterized protein n=1 Tax=Adineta steineri TaxID=433720 RepID=A0A819N6H3_9BILA|nr:unnamed protein product [Adineta steineri]
MDNNKNKGFLYKKYSKNYSKGILITNDKRCVTYCTGDQAATFVAGRLTLEEIVRMLAVSMSQEEVENKLLKSIEHFACNAVVNSPRLVTISGDEKPIDEIQQILSISYPNVFKARLCIENVFHFLH